MDILQTFFKNDYFLLIPIFLGTVVVITFFDFALRGYVKKISKKTKTTLDQTIIKIIKKPISLLIIISSIYLALKTIDIFASQITLITNIFFILIVLILGNVISKVSSAIVSNWLKVQKRFAKTPQLVTKIISIAIYAIAILIVLRYFKVDVTPLAATLGLGSLAIGLALQNTLTDFFAGLNILSDMPINVGDFIEIEKSVSGNVEDIGWRTTRVRTLTNTSVIIPNSVLAQNIIINNSKPTKETAVLIACEVSYKSNLEKVEKITIEVARKIQNSCQKAVENFEPLVRYHTFGESNIKFNVILKVKRIEDKALLTSEFIKAIKNSYDKEGIEISYPSREIYSK